MSMDWCEQGHKYDTDLQKNCPVCGKGPSDARNTGSKPRAQERASDGIEGADASPCRPAFQLVVGWLVCIGGCEMGRDYRLRAGHNRVGRDLSMQVCIACDLKVSRVDHARVFHDLETSDTYLMPGTGQNSAYLNKSAVLQPVRLKAHDVITIGDTRLRFIPFCGEHFMWDGKAHEKTAASPMHDPLAPQTDGNFTGPDTQRDDLDDVPPPSAGTF